MEGLCHENPPYPPSPPSPPPISNPLPSMTKCITLFLREFKVWGNALKCGNMKPLLGAVNLEPLAMHEMCIFL